MKNKNNSRLTIKAVKEQLDQFKLQFNKQQSSISKLKSSFKVIYLISLLGYIINKIPFINKYIKGLNSVIARTSI
jgi:hypothetical protein